MKIVLVDDEYLIVSGLAKIITKQFPDSECLCYTDPRAALAAMTEMLPDLLITDIRMPGMTGMELITQVKALGQQMYAVLTGLDDVPLLQEGIRLGVTDYLIKPVNKIELCALLERVSGVLKQNQQRETEAIARAFRIASPDQSVVPELRERLKQGDDQLGVMDTFLKATKRALYSWESCRLAVDIGNEAASDEKLENLIRSIPMQRDVASDDICTIIRHVQKHYSEEISLQELAASVYLQPNYVTTLFKKEIGQGFVQYLNSVRIDAAVREMIQRPNLPLIELAHHCGFPSDRYFFTIFKKLTGETPGAFREWLAENRFIHL